MKRNTPSAEDLHSFLFQVEILVKAKTNGSAVEQLIHVLNNGEFADYRIANGIQLGQVIEEALKRERHVPGTSAHSAPKAIAKPIPKIEPQTGELGEKIRRAIDSNKLIRLSVNKGRGVKLSMPCRILRFEEANQMLTVYHVDEKQVHTLKLFEIDDFEG